MAIASALSISRPQASANDDVTAARAPAMRALDELVERIARGQISVLVTGETGVGKELMAESIHRLSPRAHAPLLRLNCAAFSESLLESQLFGHERGAFTGAVESKPGLLETAHGGTVFLDEIGELPLAVQVKLLRVLEDRTVMRVGALAPRPIDVRFIAATNRDLEAEIERGTFRRDLYFRLDGVTLTIPPLRERVEEISGLALRFSARACRSAGRTVLGIAPDALAYLQCYAWPGNIRELRNVIERAVLLCSGEAITLADLPVAKMRAARGTVPPPSSSPAPVGGERERILEALAATGGNQSEAAKRLGISRRTLHARLDLHNVPRPRKRSS